MTEQDQSKAREAFLNAAIDLLHSGNELERATAVGVLGTLGSELVVPVLLTVLQEDPSRQVQHKTSQAIARIGGETAINGLQALMRSESYYTRFLAAEALADIVARGID
jgi:HEAT repeat protein